METFIPPRPFVPHADYRKVRRIALQGLELEIGKKAIDPLLLPLVREYMSVPHCFTLQCCYGHFVREREPDMENLAPLSNYTKDVGRIEYRFAYIAFCRENSPAGRFFERLTEIIHRYQVFV